MKFEALFDNATANALRFDWLLAELEPATDYGRATFAKIEPFAVGQQTQAAQRAREIAALAGALDISALEVVRETLRNAPDATGAIARAGMGDALTDIDFLELQRFCDTVARVCVLAGPSIPYTLPRCEEVSKALDRGRSGKFGFFLDDRFDGKLAKARAILRDTQVEFDNSRGRLCAAVARALRRPDIATQEFIVMRDELTGALPQGVRVLREAPTYYLCELELDEVALAALRQRDEAAASVASLEERVRARLSEIVRASNSELGEAVRLLGELDVLVAAARFARKYACSLPEYQTGGIEFEEAHFLPLQAELERQDRNYTPISLTLPGVAVLTGPNMGGKSVGLRTTGFIAACAAFGLPVPAKNTKVTLFARITWLGIGVAEDEEEVLLSSFAREVVRLRDALAERREPALLLIDEFARTTTPDEGRALLLALIARLRDRHIGALIATHLSGIAPAAGVPHFAVRGLRAMPEQSPDGDLRSALAQLAKLMDYTIEPVAGERKNAADGIFLAGLLGMDAAFIKNAWQLLAGGEPPVP